MSIGFDSFDIRRAAQGPLLESPDNYQAQKAVVVYIQVKCFNSFADTLIKPSDNKTQWAGLLASTRAFNSLHVI